MRFVILAALAAVAAWPAASQEPPKNQVHPYMTTPLRGDPGRVVVLQSVTIPPGGDTGRHTHPGDDYLMVQEGEILNTIDGQPPRTLKAGDSIHIDPEVVHRNQNVSNAPARTVELFIVDKDKPRLQPVK